MGYLETKLSKITALVVCTFSIIWFFWERNPAELNWPALALGISSLLAYIIGELQESILFRKLSFVDSILTERDRKLIGEFEHLLPSASSAINFLSNHDLSGSYHKSDTEPLFVFVSSWGDPERSFDDEDIEKEKYQFYQFLSQFLRDLAYNVGPTKNALFLSIIPERYYDDPNIPERYEKAVADLNSRATEAFQRHQNLMKLFGSKLKEDEKARAAMESSF